MYRVEYQNRNEFIFVDLMDQQVCQLNNRENKNFLHDDIVNENGAIIFPSKYRDKNRIFAGILQLNTSTFHGRYKTKLLYSCIPYDKNLPIFYIPYKPKYNFSKNAENLYVLFELKEFINKPIGLLKEVIGNVSLIHNYYLFELHANNLWFPQNKFNFNEEEYTKMIDCCSKHITMDRSETHHVFTIDPETCKDFDDAISIKNDIISVYISNVPVILSCLGYIELLTQQVSSIYLPNATKNMLPKSLSENICSLVADQKKKAVFYMDIYPDETIEFGVCWVTISNNFVYEDQKLLEHKPYQQLLDYAHKKSANPIIDSHDVVEFFMIFMNHECSVTLRNGIYRSTTLNTAPFSIYDYFGEYSLQKTRHDVLNLPSYGHFTSPIRRLVDIVNLILLQQQLQLISFDETILQFCESWKNKVEYINESCKKIKKVEQNMFWLNELEEMKGKGFNYIPNQKVEIIHKEQTESRLYKYTVYLKERKRIMTMKSFLNYYTIGDELNCYLYYFQNEDNMKKKARLQISS